MELVLIISGYLFCFVVGSLVVRLAIKIVSPDFAKQLSKSVLDTGLIIGICESFITITLVLLNQITGLAIIFIAKSIIRSKKMEEKAEYYLVGTMVNFTFSLLVGIILKISLQRWF
jgi:succinate dehydrogenase/fumarate reductase cytochrome b subunit